MTRTAIPRRFRRGAIATAVLLLGGLGWLPGCAVATRHVPRETTLTSARVDIPTSRREKLLVVETTLEGQGPFDLVLDTGSSALVISPEVAERLRLRTRKFPWLIHGSAESRWSWSHSGTIEDVRLGEHSHFRSIGCLVLDPGDGVDGYLGNGILADCALELDATHTRAVLTTEPTVPRPGDIPIIMQDGVPMVSVSLAGERFPVTLDTGFNGTLRLPAEWEEKLPLGRRRSKVLVTTIHSKHIEVVRRLRSELRVGPMPVRGVPVYFGPGPPLLGLEIFRNRTIRLDLRSLVLRVGPRQAASPPPPSPGARALVLGTPGADPRSTAGLSLPMPPPE